MATTSYDAKYANPSCRIRSLLISFNFLWLRRQRRILRPVELVEARGAEGRGSGGVRSRDARHASARTRTPIGGQTEGRKEGGKEARRALAVKLHSAPKPSRFFLALRPSVIPPSFSHPFPCLLTLRVTNPIFSLTSNRPCRKVLPFGDRRPDRGGSLISS